MYKFINPTTNIIIYAISIAMTLYILELYIGIGRICVGDGRIGVGQ